MYNKDSTQVMLMALNIGENHSFESIHVSKYYSFRYVYL